MWAGAASRGGLATQIPDDQAMPRARCAVIRRWGSADRSEQVGDGTFSVDI